MISKLLLREIRHDLRTLPEGWRLADAYEPDVYDPNTAAAMYAMLGRRAPEVWSRADAEPLLEEIAEWLAEQRIELGADAAGRVMFELPAQIAKLARKQQIGRDSAAKRAVQLSPLQEQVFAMEKQFAAHPARSQSAKIADRLQLEGGEKISRQSVAKIRRLLRAKGY